MSKNELPRSMQNQDVEKILSLMPKNCDCSVCCLLKNSLKSQMGESQYKKLATQYKVCN